MTSKKISDVLKLINYIKKGADFMLGLYIFLVIFVVLSIAQLTPVIFIIVRS